MVDPPEIFPLLLHGILWDFPNRKAVQGDSFLTLTIFLGILPLLDNLRMDLKVQWFSLWFQTRISFSSFPKRSSVNHSLVMYSPMSLATTTSISNSSKLVGCCYGLLVVVSRSFPASRLSSCPIIRIFQVSPQEDSLVCSSMVSNMDGYGSFWYCAIFTGDRGPMKPSLVSAEGSDGESEPSSEVDSLVGSSLGYPVFEVGFAEGGSLGDLRGQSSSLLKSSG